MKSKVRQTEWSALTPKICQLAQDAGEAIMRIYLDVSQCDALLAHKSDGSPLTLADMASHHTIVRGLAELTPEIPVVSEEDADSLCHRQDLGMFWLIDPLDGTKEFLARNDEFTVNIALIHDATPVWGVVYAPALNQMFCGGRDFGAFRQADGITLHIRVSSPLEPRQPYRVVASKSHLNAETSAFIEKLGATQLVQAGSSLKFCRIAEGNADVYPRLAPTCEWDTAAAQAVVEGAGGYVYDTTGVCLRYGKPDVLNPSFIAASVPLSKLNGVE
jgi:3'(2'), 5'-bisphosphate nucleotidase